MTEETSHLSHMHEGPSKRAAAQPVGQVPVVLHPLPFSSSVLGTCAFPPAHALTPPQTYRLVVCIFVDTALQDGMVRPSILP